jgi:SHS2 domain-containing protein
VNEPQTPEWLEEVDHTADAGFIVWASGLEELFERTAWAMFTLIVDMETVQVRVSEEVRVEGTDLEDLLVRWLSDLNFRHITRSALFSRFRVEAIEETCLRATVEGEEVDPARHTIFTEIKAVTYHKLSIARTDGAYRAYIVFDL